MPHSHPWGKVFSLSPLNIILVVDFFVDSLDQVEEVPSTIFI